MTNEEAIRELKADYCGNRIICELYPDQCNREDCEIWLAIKALVEQPIRVLETQPEVAKDTNVPNTDCISRQQKGVKMLDIKEYLKQTKTVLLTQDAFDELMQRESAQPEIIRCKDCKHRLSSLYCEAWNNSPGFPCIGDEMFCSLAERRTDGQTD